MKKCAYTQKMQSTCHTTPHPPTPFLLFCPGGRSPTCTIFVIGRYMTLSYYPTLSCSFWVKPFMPLPADDWPIKLIALTRGSCCFSMLVISSTLSLYCEKIMILVVTSVCPLLQSVKKTSQKHYIYMYIKNIMWWSYKTCHIISYHIILLLPYFSSIQSQWLWHSSVWSFIITVKQLNLHLTHLQWTWNGSIQLRPVLLI